MRRWSASSVRLYQHPELVSSCGIQPPNPHFERTSETLGVTVAAVDEDIWQALDISLTPKRTRQATLSRLSQSLRKRFADFPDNNLTEGNCELWRESLSAEQLQRCNPGHARTEPYQMSGPVVVLERGSER